MRRDLQKAAAEYTRMIEKLPNNQACFYASDVQQIIDACGSWHNFDPWKAVTLALNAGFIIGFRFAKKQDRRSQS